MSHPHASPCIMTNTDEFYVRICGCGVVHLSFGCSVINLSPLVALAVSETLQEVTQELKKKYQTQPTSNPLPTHSSVASLENLIICRFPLSPDRA